MFNYISVGSVFYAQAARYVTVDVLKTPQEKLSLVQNMLTQVSYFKM